MSYENYGGSFPPQNGGQETPTAPVPGTQEAPVLGQNNGSGVPPMQFSPTDVGNGQQQQQPGPSGDQNKTLWMGDLDTRIGDEVIRQAFLHMGEQVSVKMIRDKFSASAGYCFVEFSSPQAAGKALQLNGQPLPTWPDQHFKLNWSSGGGLADRRDDRSPEFSIFVGDLGPEVNEFALVSLFQSRFPSCKSAKIMTDPITTVSRGYGFVRFSEEQDQKRALTEMQGVYCGNRPMRISTATPKNKGGPAGMGHMMGGAPNPMGVPGGFPPQMGGPPPMTPYYGQPQPMNQFTDPNNTTVFVGGLSGYVTEDELRSFFQGFGEITYVKIPPGKGCGFVQFVQRHAAEMAINQMQGYPIGNSRVRLSWGRSQNNSGPAGTPYRPTPGPANYPAMGMPSYPYGNYAPMK